MRKERWSMPAAFKSTVSAAFLIAAAGSTLASESGLASHYPASYEGRRTASGERFDPKAMTCAHKRYPFGVMLRVSIGARAITCRVTDRGPFIRGRVLDLTPAAANALGFSGLARVTIDPI